MPCQRAAFGKCPSGVAAIPPSMAIHPPSNPQTVAKNGRQRNRPHQGEFLRSRSKDICDGKTERHDGNGHGEVPKRRNGLQYVNRIQQPGSSCSSRDVQVAALRSVRVARSRCSLRIRHSLGEGRPVWNATVHPKRRY
jgi:hypothetical protein